MGIGCSTHTTSNLRGNNNVITIFPRAHPAPDDHLGIATNVTRNPGRVNICRINKVAAAREVSVQHSKRGLLVMNPAKNVATQAKCCYFQVRPAKLTCQHKNPSIHSSMCSAVGVRLQAALSQHYTVYHWRAFPHSKAQPAGCRTMTQLRRPTLSGPSISRKRHESVMNIVMGSGLSTIHN